MPGRGELQGAMDSLFDTLQRRLDPRGDRQVNERWLGATGKLTALMRRHVDWMAVPDPHDPCAGVTGDVSASTSALAGARSKEEQLAALDRVHAALDAVERLLDDPASTAT